MIHIDKHDAITEWHDIMHAVNYTVTEVCQVCKAANIKGMSKNCSNMHKHTNITSRKQIKCVHLRVRALESARLQGRSGKWGGREAESLIKRQLVTWSSCISHNRKHKASSRLSARFRGICTSVMCPDSPRPSTAIFFQLHPPQHRDWLLRKWGFRCHTESHVPVGSTCPSLIVLPLSLCVSSWALKQRVLGGGWVWGVLAGCPRLWLMDVSVGATKTRSVTDISVVENIPFLPL